MDCTDPFDVAGQDPQYCPNSAVDIVNGVMGVPLNSNLVGALVKPASGLSSKESNNPAPAKGSTADAVVVAAFAAATPSALSSTTVSTMPAAGAKTAGGSGVRTSKFVAGGGAGAGGAGASQDDISNKSISGAGAGAGGGAATGTGGAAADGVDRAARCAAADVGERLGTKDGVVPAVFTTSLPGTMPPNKAAAMRSFSNCASLFSGTVSGAGVPP